MSNEYHRSLERIALSTCFNEITNQLLPVIIQTCCRKIVSMIIAMSSGVVAPGPYTCVWYFFRQQIPKPQNIFSSLVLECPCSFAMAIEAMNCYNAMVLSSVSLKIATRGTSLTLRLDILQNKAVSAPKIRCHPHSVLLSALKLHMNERLPLLPLLVRDSS